MKPTIGILSTFYEMNPSYSLCSVVEAQLTALVKYGYKTVFFVHDNFRGTVPEGVEVRKIVPRFNLVDYSSHQTPEESLEKQADVAYLTFKQHFKDIDIILEHDLIFQGWFLPYCMAIHRLAKESKIKWFHWIHSNPSPRPNLSYPHILRYTLPANSKLVYLNNQFLVKVAESYGAWPKDVRIVYNPVDPRSFFNLHPLVKSLIDKYLLLEADFVQVYPVSSTRMVDGKGLYTLIDIFSKLKKEGKKVCLIIANAHANADREKETIKQAKDYALQKQLNSTELVFTSLEGKEYESGVSREVVSQLFTLSNLFIFPSSSENCSLVLLEAMLSKNLLILNEDVKPMKEFGKDMALYFKFGGAGETVNYQDREAYMHDVAKIAISEMSTNRALKASNEIKKFYSYDYIFKNSIEPLFWES